jgi:hypothetical protein
MEVKGAKRGHRLWLGLESLSPVLGSQDRRNILCFGREGGGSPPFRVLQSLILQHWVGRGGEELTACDEFIVFFGTSMFSSFNFSEAPTNQKRSLP